MTSFPGRAVEGYYVALLEFENGVPATLVHNGYFSINELVPWAGNSRFRESSAELRRESLGHVSRRTS